MEASTEAWRLTLPTLKFIAKEKFKLAKPQPKPKQPQPKQPDDQSKPETIPEEKKKKPEFNQDTPCCLSCRYVRSKTCGSDKSGLKCKKPAPVVIPSVSSISKSVSANCGHCCCAFCEFLKEAYRTTQGDSKSRVCDVLSDVSDTLLAIANDCVLFVRSIGVSTASKAQNGIAMAKNKVMNLRQRKSKTQNIIDEKPVGVLKREKPSIDKFKGILQPDKMPK